MLPIPKNLPERIAAAVTHFWSTREEQAKKQQSKGQVDQGARGAVTGGAQMDGFVTLVTEILVEAGVHESAIFHSAYLELPGYFRPTKEWDLLVVQDEQLIAALETKSQVGPSFGNNFNNRTEEAIGSAVDLWTSFREGALNKTTQPWLGYVFLLEDSAASRRPTSVREPHFEVFPEFKGASYAKRYEIRCRKLVRERHYSAAAFLMSQRDSGRSGQYQEPAADLLFESFVRSLTAQVAAWPW